MDSLKQDPLPDNWEFGLVRTYQSTGAKSNPTQVECRLLLTRQKICRLIAVPRRSVGLEKILSGNSI